MSPRRVLGTLLLVLGALSALEVAVDAATRHAGPGEGRIRVSSSPLRSLQRTATGAPDAPAPLSAPRPGDAVADAATIGVRPPAPPSVFVPPRA